VVGSFLEPVDALYCPGIELLSKHRIAGGPSLMNPTRATVKIMQSALPDGRSGLPEDVLIVEDDPIIALDFEDTVLGLGAKTVRSAGSVARALQLIAERAPDFALLDVSLVREKSFAVAERLDALNIPFAFVTGYGAEIKLPEPFGDRPRLTKPYSTQALQVALRAWSGT
jgi:CheY-like chemotaxis protein